VLDDAGSVMIVIQ